MNRLITWGTTIALIALLPALARAHDEVSRMRSLVTDGRYEEVRPQLDAALDRTDFSREDLIELLEVRALLFHALPDEPQLEHTLRMLASLAPEHRFGPRYPPDLTERFSTIRAALPGGLRVSTRVVPSAVGVRLEARVEDDPTGLVRELRYRVFNLESSRWEQVAPPIESPAGRDQLVLVEAIGPAGAVVARAGSSDEPLHLADATAASVLPTEPESPEPDIDGGDDWVPWVVLAVVAAVVGAGVVGGVVFALENPTTITWRARPPRELP